MNDESFPARPIPEGAVLIPENAKCAYKGELFDVYRFPQKMYDGSTKIFEMLRRPDTVLVVPVTDDGKIWVIREEQPHRGLKEMRLPGGRADMPNETALQAAQRECEEEIGIRFKEWYYLESMQPERKIDWFVHVFVAREPYETVPTQHDNGEKIEVYQTSYEEFLEKGYSSKRIKAFEELKTLDDLMARARRV